MSRRPADDAGNSNSYSEESTESQSYTINFSIRVRSLKKIVRQEIARSRDEKKSQRKSKKKRKIRRRKARRQGPSPSPRVQETRKVAANVVEEVLEQDRRRLGQHQRHGHQQGGIA